MRNELENPRHPNYWPVEENLCVCGQEAALGFAHCHDCLESMREIYEHEQELELVEQVMQEREEKQRKNLSCHI